MRRVAVLLVAVLLFGAGCRDDSSPGVDQQVDDIESTLDAIESELG